MNPFPRNPCQLRNPATNERSLRVVFLTLFDRIVNPNRVDPRHPCLHLKLRKVNARLEIEKTACQMLHPVLPRMVHVMRQKADHHGAHSKVQIPRLPDAPHAGIHKRNSC